MLVLAFCSRSEHEFLHTTPLPPKKKKTKKIHLREREQHAI